MFGKLRQLTTSCVTHNKDDFCVSELIYQWQSDRHTGLILFISMLSVTAEMVNSSQTLYRRQYLHLARSPGRIKESVIGDFWIPHIIFHTQTIYYISIYASDFCGRSRDSDQLQKQLKYCMIPHKGLNIIQKRNIKKIIILLGSIFDCDICVTYEVPALCSDQQCWCVFCTQYLS